MDLRIEYSLLQARKMLSWLIAMDISLVLVYVMIHILAPEIPWGPARALFDLDREVSLPTWFSSIQLFMVGGMLFVASRNNRRNEHLPSSFLIAISLIFFFLSADESAAIHEKITSIAIKLDLGWLLIGGNHGAWITIYLIIMVGFIIVGSHFFRMLWRHFRQATLIGLIGSIVFLLGAVGIEVLSYLFLRPRTNTILYPVSIACEEFLEMSGVSVMLYAVLLLASTISSPLSDTHSN